MKRGFVGRLIASACATIVTPAIAVEVPPGFTAERLATGLNAATALAPASDGRIFIADQTGLLRVWHDGQMLPSPVLDLSTRVDNYWERGLIGVTLHPDFPRVPHLFVLYVAKTPFTRHVLSRLTLAGDTVDPASEVVLLEGDDQKRFGGFQSGGHQGGPLRFGPDGRLYVALGEQTAGELAPRLDALQGKILRLNADGTIPADNPFVARAAGKYRAIWATGLRNPFGLAFQPETSRLFATDAGQSSWEEINEISRGANYGWPTTEGAGTNPDLTNPLHAYPQAIGRSIVGGAFYPKSKSVGSERVSGRFPERWHGRFFFADWAANWVKTIDPDAPAIAAGFARGLNKPVAVEVAPDGSLLVLERGTIWIDGAKFASNAGSLTRIRYVGDNMAASAANGFPARLSAAGIFRDLAEVTPTEEFLPFELNLPLWLPGVSARRWISIPGNGEIVATPEGELRLPAGAVVVQHFTVSDGRAFETHVYWFTDQSPRVAAYRWAKGGRDAVLVTESEIVDLPGKRMRQWHSPGAETALNLDAMVSGFVLQLNLRQLNRDVPDRGNVSAAESKINQLALWSRRGWFATPLTNADISRVPRLAPLEDAAAPIELRVRSYLEANCASCHRPGGPSRAGFDTRIGPPLAATGLIDGVPIAGDLGIPDARIVVPGAPEKSLLLRRLQDDGAFRMPPVRLHDEPAPVLPILEQWIRSLR